MLVLLVVGEGPALHIGSSPAERATQAVEKYGGSVRAAIAELNQHGFSQDQMQEALEAAWRASGRDTAGVLVAQDGTRVLLSRRIGPDQPVNLIRPNGTAEFGRAELYIDTANPRSPIGVRNVRTADGAPLAMPHELSSRS